MNKLVTSILLGFLFGCHSLNENLHVNHEVLFPIKKITQINDTIFLSLVTNMTEHNGLMYMTDFKNNRIVCVDSTYNFIRFYGSAGNGPSELNFPGGSKAINDELYVIDEGHKKINIYDIMEGTFIGNIKGLLPRSGRFIVKDSIYFGSPMVDNNTPPIFKAYLDGKAILQFGTNDRVLDIVNKNAARMFFLEKWRNQIVAICKDDPIVERYTFNGELIGSYDFSKLEYFDSYISHIKKKQEKEWREYRLQGIASFFTNSYLDGNRLYLLLAGFDKSTNKETCNHILVLNIEKENITPLKILKLENNDGNEGWYYSFCVTSNKLISYEAHTYEIHEFKINF